MQRKHFNETRDHLVRLAMLPGWWDYVKARARELERHESRLYLHIERDVAQQLQQLGWRPPKQPK